MANYSSLLAAVNAAITANGTGAITGPVLNTVLQQMIVSLGQGGYIFKGRAIPTTDPGSPDQNVFYIATTPGTYTNFSSIVVAAGECAILKGSGTSWSKEATGIDLVSVSQNTSTGHTDITIGDTTTPVASVEEVSQLGQKVDRGLYFDVNSNVCTRGKYVNGSIGGVLNVGNLATGAYLVIPCQFNQVFEIKTRSENIARTYYLLDQDNKIICVGGHNALQVKTTFVSVGQENARYIAINFDAESATQLDGFFVKKYEQQFFQDIALSFVRNKLKIDHNSVCYLERVRVSGNVGEQAVFDNPNYNSSGGVLKIPCSLGQTFSFYTRTDGLVRGWYVLDSANNILQVGETSSALIGGQIDITELSARWLYVSVFPDSTEIDDYYVKPDGYNVEKVVTPEMNKADFCYAINYKNHTGFADFLHCHISCLPNLDDTTSWLNIYEQINKNFREEIYVRGMTHEEVCDRVNVAFTKKIYRFCDAKPDPVNTGIDWSLDTFPTDTPTEEPSAIVSPNGDELYIYAHMKRYTSKDGIHFDNGTPLVTDRYLMHCGVNYIDGVYYLIGENTDTAPIELHTSIDGINFTRVGVIFPSNFDIFGDGTLIAEYYGNPYLCKIGGRFYLFYEIHAQGDLYYEMCCAVSDDILHDNGDGTFGVWIQSPNNPIIPSQIGNYVLNCGNFDFPKAENNQPIKVDGKYYAYFHGWYGNYRDVTAIYRAVSENLFSWEIDGICFDNRDTPTNPYISGNGDHCVVQFKGQTFMYYTYDINQTPIIPRLKILIDSRPFSELLKLRP